MTVLLQGNLSEFVKVKPEARSYYDLEATGIKFVLPEPGFLEGIKSKDRAILKLNRVGFKCAFPPPLSSPACALLCSTAFCLPSHLNVIT